MEELTNQRIAEKIKEKFGEKILSSDESYNLLSLNIKRENLLEILQYLYQDEELGFKFLTDITGIHYPDPNEEMAAIYHLHNMIKNKRIRLRAFFPKSDPWINSATPLFSAANWMERETYDFFGIIFKGHPNLKRILNVDEMDYFPLRKEYALEDPTRTDKDDSMFGR
jgi:NADH-quinone oxidoreductase subunit C